MVILISALIILTCILLVIIVLIQNPKGGGLSSSFGGSGTQMFGGVKKTTDFLDKGTWALSIVLMVLVLSANVLFTPEDRAAEQQASEVLDADIAPAPAINSFPQGGGATQEIPQGVDPNEGEE